MKKTSGTLLCVMLALVICLATGCTPPSPAPPAEYPAEPALTLSSPAIKMPEVPDAELVGSANASDPKYSGVIYLKGTAAEVVGGNVSVFPNTINGTEIEITGSGTYLVQGTLRYGYIVIAQGLQVTLVLNGVNIFCGDYSPIVCVKQSSVTIELAPNSKNYLTNGSIYICEYDESHEPTACLYVNGNLTIGGSGALTVNSNYNDAIGAAQNLKISGGEISVCSAYNGLRGKNSVEISGGSFQIIAHEDGIKTDGTAGEGKGNINISGGSFSLATVGDALDAAAQINISNAQMSVKTQRTVTDHIDSFKGLKAVTCLTINSGSLVIYAADNALHSGGDVVISGGEIIIRSAGSGINAKENLLITYGSCYVSSRESGITAKNIAMSGGLLIIQAPDSQGCSAVSYGGGFAISGGMFIAFGGTENVRQSGFASSQNSVFAKFSSAIPAGALVNIKDPSGGDVITITCAKNSNSLFLTSPELMSGKHKLSVGGEYSSSASAFGICSGGIYSGGAVKKTFTVSAKITNVK